MEDLFLKIVAGEIPCSRVYEDAQFFAFLDIKPINKGHTLVIPKRKYRNIFDMDADTFASLGKAAHHVALAVKKATGADGINITMNNEAAAGQDVFHAHMHVIPRFTDDYVFTPPHHTTYDEGEKDVVAEKIRQSLA